jgi:hypothetical protein
VRSICIPAMLLYSGYFTRDIQKCPKIAKTQVKAAFVRQFSEPQGVQSYEISLDQSQKLVVLLLLQLELIDQETP